METEIQNFKSDLAGGDTDTAMVTGDHNSRSTDFTNLVTSKEAIGIGHGNQGSMTAPIGDVMPTLTNDDFKGPMPAVAYHYAVRRITPIEGERLQGFADGWTRPCFTAEQLADDALVDQFVGIHQNWATINGKPDAKPKSREAVRKWMATISSPDCPDGPRYKAIGNSMSVNVMAWIGMRIDEAERQTTNERNNDQ